MEHTTRIHALERLPVFTEDELAPSKPTAERQARGNRKGDTIRGIGVPPRLDRLRGRSGQAAKRHHRRGSAQSPSSPVHYIAGSAGCSESGRHLLGRPCNHVREAITVDVTGRSHAASQFRSCPVRLRAAVRFRQVLDPRFAPVKDRNRALARLPVREARRTHDQIREAISVHVSRTGHAVAEIRARHAALQRDASCWAEARLAPAAHHHETGLSGLRVWGPHRDVCEAIGIDVTDPRHAGPQLAARLATVDLHGRWQRGVDPERTAHVHEGRTHVEIRRVVVAGRSHDQVREAVSVEVASAIHALPKEGGGLLWNERCMCAGGSAALQSRSTSQVDEHPALDARPREEIARGADGDVRVAVAVHISRAGYALPELRTPIIGGDR